MSLTSQKPTGVFVQLPLDVDDIRKMDQAMSQRMMAHSKPTLESASEAAILAIGTPVTGGELEVVAYDNIASGYLSRVEPVTPNINLVRQSDAQAQIAALEAEVVRLRSCLEGILPRASTACHRSLSGRETRLLAGYCADAREALKGGAA